MPSQQFGGIRRNIALQNIRAVKLTQDFNHLVLSRRLARLFTCSFPDLLYRSFAIHQSNDGVRGGSKTVEPLHGKFLEHVPCLSAIEVTVNLRMAAQTRF